MKLNNRGSLSTFFILGILSLVAVVGYFMLYRIDQGARFFERNISKVRVSFEAEGIVRSFVKLTQEYLDLNYTIDEAGLRTHINAALTSITPPGHSIDSWDVELDTTSTISPIPSGAFTGLQSDMRNVKYKVKLVHLATGESSTVTVVGSIAGITFTQFSLFSFGSLTQHNFVQALTYNGRVHANGAVCLGARPRARMKYLTATGPIRHIENSVSPCSIIPGTFTNIKTEVATDDSFTTFGEVLKDVVSGCVNCEGTGMNWDQYALWKWNGHLQDQAHHVPKLILNLRSTPVSQAGYYGRERFLIEPLVNGEEKSVHEMKFAYKADIRIINGVWYIKNPDNPDDWPGIPVWSDHPGHFTTWNEELIEGNKNVGQLDIKEWADAKAAVDPSFKHVWTGGLPPKKYSYYEYDHTAQKIYDNDEGIISYGNLVNPTGGAQDSKPGFYANNSATENKLCDAAVMCSNCGSYVDKLIPIDYAFTCASGSQPDKAAKILSGTRSGFRNGVMYSAGMPSAERSSLSLMLPMNFNLKKFQEALKCNYNFADPTDPTNDHLGEIGCYFTSWGLMKRKFNGIVFITNTWPGSLKGLTSSGSPRRPPYSLNVTDAVFPGATNADNTQVAVSHPAQQRALPMNLCSGDIYGQKFDQNSLFKIPKCSWYDLSSGEATLLRTRTQVVRLVDAGDLDPTVLDHGLSFITNTGLYINGPLNTGATWKPVIVAGDLVHFQSRNWSDDNSRWDVPTESLVATRLATTTTYNAAVLTGYPYAMHMEDWRGVNFTLNGPILKPGSYVYHNFTNWGPGDRSFYWPAAEVKQYDPRFEAIINQPPGVPFMNVFATKSWKRQ